MISLLRAANRFDASDAKTRRHVVRLKLTALLAEARARSRFYARDRQTMDALLTETDDDRFFETFRALRPLEKSELVESFDRIATDREIDLAAIEAWDRTHPDGTGVFRTSRGDHQIIKTSGTSGTTVYIVDRVANIKRVMATVLFRALFRTLFRTGAWLVLVPFLRPLYRLFRKRVTPRTPKKPVAPYRPSLGARLLRFIRPSLVVFVHRGNRSVYRGTTSSSQPLVVRMIVDIHLVSHEEPLATILARTQWQQPELIFGLPSRVEWLARAQIEGSLAIDPVAVYVGGETFHPELRETLRVAWPNALVLNTYGATETKAIATACHECGELHVLEDFVYLELEDEHGRPVGVGEPAARVYCTGLLNQTTPVVRYAMTDVIERLPDAGCKLRTARIRVRGREPAFLWSRHAGTGEWVALNGRMLKERIVAIEGLLGFLVRYERPRELAITLVATRVDDLVATRMRERARAGLAALCEEFGGSLSDFFDEPTIDVLDADAWNREGGKLDVIVSKVVPETLERGARAISARG